MRSARLRAGRCERGTVRRRRVWRPLLTQRRRRQQRRRWKLRHEWSTNWSTPRGTRRARMRLRRLQHYALSKGIRATTFPRMPSVTGLSVPWGWRWWRSRRQPPSRQRRRRQPPSRRRRRPRPKPKFRLMPKRTHFIRVVLERRPSWSCRPIPRRGLSLSRSRLMRSPTAAPNSIAPLCTPRTPGRLSPSQLPIDIARSRAAAAAAARRQRRLCTG
mmetsp:Transcript_11824/g.19061  ORF Transcript_11824/g.19061 Transcript_11824/m.19061 type:complete len:216 (-) Transcript_11824:60-707(-)